MSQPNNSTFAGNIKTGVILIKETARGLEFHAINYERGQLLHIGTISGIVYETVKPILEKPERSFCVSRSEYEKLTGLATGIIRVITPAKDRTYAITVKDFDQHKKSYYHKMYGYQWRCALKWFSDSPEVVQRNAILDNPPIAVERDIIQDRIDQLSLFQ